MKLLPILLMLSAVGIGACNNTEKEKEPAGDKKPVAILEQAVDYTANGIAMHGFVAFDSNSTEKRPVVMIVPEWWGLNEYPKARAKQLAALGYIAMVVDMYGNGKTADNPDTASAYAMPFYKDPQMAKTRFDAAMEKVKQYAQADTSKIAAIGYCFGGSMVLNMAKLGENLQGVVSFHGDLDGVPANKDLLKAKILVCHGMADKFVSPESVANFKKQMDSIKADYIFKAYTGATHAFTNPAATATGEKFKMPIAYNAAADSASWNEMKVFFGRIFK